MSNPQDVAVAFLLEQDRKEAEQNLRAMFESVPSKPKKVRIPKAPRVPQEAQFLKISGPVAPPHLSHIVPGSLEAKGFLRMLSRAKDRAESIEAIHTYMGYDITQDFGAQEYRAKAKAQKELKPISVAESAKATVQGYVAGMPNHADKFRGNLKARERNAVEAHIENTWKAEQASDMMGKNLFSGLAQVETDRLRVIRQDLRTASGHHNTLLGLGG